MLQSLKVRLLLMRKQSPVKLFITYSHKDEALRQALCEHLASLQREGLIDVWHDRKIGAGQEWQGKIDDNLEKADIVLCLVSASFFGIRLLSGYRD